MHHYPKSIRELIRHMARLPGIGEKTAERLALHILRHPLNDAEQLAASILAVKHSAQLCSQCYALSDDTLCDICRDPARDPAVICVVEQPADMANIEKSGAFRGLYHILGGVIAPMDGIGPEQLRLRALFERIDRSPVTEIILATSTGVEGEATASFIAQRLKSTNARVTRIASGVPVGGDLKYVDQMTLKCAMDGRHVC